ncbi:nucleotidyltransferase domain-containing protein [Streptomyces sp. ODS28]|uniref:nucleotidyltransferase domain-containing protein n=1 Tax=Streptomyces sp. ODS28 TaxID=3136688 RepID=UPI0031F145C9
MHHPLPRTAGAADAAPALARRIGLLRAAAAVEPRIDGVLLYGSWTVGEADAYSDIEAYVFLRDDSFPGGDGLPGGDGARDFDGTEFLRRLGELRLAYTNMFGTLAVVFDDLMRGEFHFEPAGPGIEKVASWEGMVHLPDPEAAVLLDRGGRLTPVARRLADLGPPEPGPTARRLTAELANWTLMLAHVLARGETARAHALLHTMVAPQQLRLCRLLRGSTAHWLTPSRALEGDLPEADVRRYAATTAPAEPAAVRAAARASWAWSRELAAEAASRWGLELPRELHEDIAQLL